VYAWWKAMQHHEIVCCISLISANEESYMFHTPNIRWTRLQAEAARVAHLVHETRGVKEEELSDLKTAIWNAKREYQLDGIVTGAILSQYQKSRIEAIAQELSLIVLNPLWQISEDAYMQDLIEHFCVIVSGVASEPFDETWLGKKLDKEALKKLHTFQTRYRITLTGEGGEYESFVCDAPQFQESIRILAYKQEYANYRGIYRITDAVLEKW
jgi:ABC transporter with metal-binding/Fe-S-binding domain ATP-binding protein